MVGFAVSFLDFDNVEDLVDYGFDVEIVKDFVYFGFEVTAVVRKWVNFEQCDECTVRLKEYLSEWNRQCQRYFS